MKEIIYKKPLMLIINGLMKKYNFRLILPDNTVFKECIFETYRLEYKYPKESPFIKDDMPKDWNIIGYVKEVDDTPIAGFIKIYLGNADRIINEKNLLSQFKTMINKINEKIEEEIVIETFIDLENIK